MKPTSASDRGLFDFVRLAEGSGTTQPLDPQALFYCSTCSTSKMKKGMRKKGERRKRWPAISLVSLLSSPVAILAQEVEQVEQVEQSLILLDIFVFGFWNEVDQVEHAPLISRGG
jgi:hypothetical protein